MRAQNARLASAALLAAALLPLHADGGQAECFNVTTSLATTVGGPTAGDEQFFTLPVGPANVMFLLDSSQSMDNIPQCGDMNTSPSSWGSWNVAGKPSCVYPAFPAIGGAAATGTCDTTGNPQLQWMQEVVRQEAYADPGRGTSALGLVDAPSWGTGCSGDGCLFDPAAYYQYGNWTQTSAPRVASPCVVLDNVGNPTTDHAGNVIPAPSDCQACLDAKGFYLFRARYQSGVQRVSATESTGVIAGATYTVTNTAGFAHVSVRDELGALMTRVASAPLADQYTVTAGGVYGFNAAADGKVYTIRYTYDGGATYTTVDQVRFKGSWLNGNPPKFVSARKVIKDLVWTPSSDAKLDAVRFGLTLLSSTSTIAGGARIVVPLGPDRTGSFPTSSAAMVAARQYVVDFLNRKTIVTDLPSGGSTLNYSGYSLVSGFTPLATTLFTLGQYFTSTGTYASRFGATYETANHAQGYSGAVNAPWARSNGNQCSICWGCQQSSIIVVTDGSPNNEAALPAAITSYDQASYASGANCGADGSLCVSPSATAAGPSPLPRVASWLHTQDLRGDLANAQSVVTSTVSFGVSDPGALRILQATANLGGGVFNNASNGRELAGAVASAVNNVLERANSFSAPAAASLSTLQTVAAEAVITRFRPNDTPTWEGHVYQGLLFDEFLAGCDPTRPPAQQPQATCQSRTVSANFNGDAGPDGLSLCNGVFLVDADCDEVVEDPVSGAFLKKGQGNTPANMFWDAGFALSNKVYPVAHPKAGQAVPGYRAADARRILTAVNGATVPLDAASAAALAPWMNLPTSWCTAKLAEWSICGAAPLPACADVPAQCARAVIDFVHGWDVTDNDGDGCGGPLRTTNAARCVDHATGLATGVDGEERDRASDRRLHEVGGKPVFWKLGDVFHSSPVVVKPPASEIVCATGFDNQCVMTLFSPPSFARQTDIRRDYPDGTGQEVDAYASWRLGNAAGARPRPRDRRQIVLVGANDGMLHAFDAGVPDTSRPRNQLGTHPYTPGTGEELWAFVPPDLLPRLKDLVDRHQYMVDGNVLVRDVWVDGTTQVPGLGAPPNNRKEHEEYHTLAVLTERAGGNQYVALDVTDTENPTYLWSFPRAGTDDERYMGQSWSDFAPGPPPIGPVRLATRDGVPDPTGRGFEERWIVMANGGYDPTLARGRAVWMLDAWTGQPVWRYTDDDFKRDMGYAADGRAGMFPVVGTVGAVDIGDPTLVQGDADGFFDTATWGDLAGSLFTARFWSVGVPDADQANRVGNWLVARAFEQRRQEDDRQLMPGRSPFFQMPENVFDPLSRTLRTYLGSGNRERSMQSAGECTPDNLLGCCAAGCSVVEATATEEFGACAETTRFTCAGGVLRVEPQSSSCAGAVCGGSAVPAPAAPAPAWPAGTTFAAQVRMHFVCPGTPPAPTGVDVTGTLTCDASGVCAPVIPVGSAPVGANLPAPTTRSRFYGIWSYGGPGRRFDSPAEARAFERNRFTDVDFANPPGGCAGPAGGACTLFDVTDSTVSFDPASPLVTSVSCPGGGRCEASADDPGWFYEYGRRCPLDSCSPAPPWFDEKTAAGASVVLGCTSWGGFRPIGSQSGADPCSGNVGTPVSYNYLADYLTGVPTGSCGYRLLGPGNLYLRAMPRDTISTPSSKTIRVVVSPRGEVKYQGLEFPPGGGAASGMVAPTDYGTRTDLAEPVYWLEVSRDLHDCRHDPARAATSCR